VIRGLPVWSMRLPDDSSTPGSRHPSLSASERMNNLNKNQDIQFHSIPPSDVLDVDEDFQPDEAQTEGAASRGQWSGKWDFLMACLSYAVGLGNLWRFPYLVYRNGGGAFLIPYLIMNVLAGVPLFLSEMSIGQFSSSGAVNVWRLCPLAKGMGFAMVMVSGVVAPYYNMIIAWAMVYLFSSFTSTLPWSHCNNPWNTDYCSLKHTAYIEALKENCTTQYFDASYKNGICTYYEDKVNSTIKKLVMHNLTLRSAADEYFHGGVLEMTEGFHEIGVIRWQLVLALLAAWALTFCVIVKGPQSSGKVAYFTAIFPYIVLTILLIRGLTLPGFEKGIHFYITPNWTKLTEPSVWGDAAVQVTFSLSCGWGGVLTLASYKTFHGNILRDVYFICGVTAGTAIFSGFVIFSVVGFMAHTLGVEVSEVAAQGAGLAFIAYPEAIAKMPISPLWSILFFSMILTLGIGTQIAIVTTVVSTIIDSSYRLLSRRLETTIALCIFGFLLGLPLCSGAGMYILQLLDNYIATWSIIIICICECMIFTFIYGVDRLLDDIACMMGHRPHPFWKVFWSFITPVTLFFILISTFVDYGRGKGSSYGDYEFPFWADSLGLMISFISILFIPGVAVFQLLKEEGPWSMRWRKLTRPTVDWGPADPVHRAEYKLMSPHRSGLPFTPTAASTIPMLQNVINEEFRDSPLNSEVNLEAFGAAHGVGTVETPEGPPNENNM